MAAAAVAGEEKLKARKSIAFISAVSSPFKLFSKFCETIMTSSQAEFPIFIASMAMAGGIASVHLACVLVQTNAEILAGIVLTQLVRKGTPVVYNSHSTAMNLRLGTSPLATRNRFDRCNCGRTLPILSAVESGSWIIIGQQATRNPGRL
jgi:trimethylamine--corrinoid protein Co-methyltransferase